MISFEQIKQNKEINTCIETGNESLGVLGFTEHSFAHASRTAKIASYILKELDYDGRMCELASIAGYMHDIGNVINRADHAQSGAILANSILTRMDMDITEIAKIISAIGNHDEQTAAAVNPLSAALILSDKSDVRRSRVRERDKLNWDIHDRVNDAVTKSDLKINKKLKTCVLELTIDTERCPVMDYFEIFLNRMVLCRKSADYLGLIFELIINKVRLL